MTSSNGNIFRATGPLCGEFTGPGEFPAQRPVTRSFDIFFDLHPNKRLSKQWWGWWFETQSCPLWRHRNELGNDQPNGNVRQYSLIGVYNKHYMISFAWCLTVLPMYGINCRHLFCVAMWRVGYDTYHSHEYVFCWLNVGAALRIGM